MKHKCTQNANWVGEFLPQKTRAGLLCRWGCLVCTIQTPEWAVCDNSTHHLYPHWLCKSTGRGRKAQQDYTHLLNCHENRVWRGAQTHHGKSCGSWYKRPTIHMESSLKCYPPTTTLPKQQQQQQKRSWVWMLPTLIQHIPHGRPVAAQGTVSEGRYS